MSSRTPSALIIGLALLACAVFPGCGSRPDKVAVDEHAYRGPAVSADPAGEHYVLMVTAPSAGWEFTFDQAKPVLGFTEVYVTARTPNPAYMHTQAQVQQRIGTTVETRAPIRVFVRVVEYGRSLESAPYRSAGQFTR